MSFTNKVVFLAIILLAFIARTVNLNYNSPFLDEAIYINLGKQILSGEIIEAAENISWVGGFPFFYPLLSSLAYLIGKIVAARLLNVILGTASVYLIYLFTKRLSLFKHRRFNEIAGLVACAFFATSAIPIVFSRIAIYDTLSFSLFLFSLVIFQKAFRSNKKKLYFYSAVILFLSYLAKYIILIFFPFFLLITLYFGRKKDIRKKNKVVKIFKNFWYPFLFLNFVYFSLNAESLAGFYTGQVVAGEPVTQVLENFWKFTSIGYILALGSIYFFLDSRKIKIAILLIASSLLPLISHAIAKNSISVQQHTTLSLIFLFPLAGAFFASIIKRYKYLGITAAFITVILSLSLSLPMIQDIQESWPNSDEAIRVLKSRMDKEDRILAEADDVIILAFYDDVPRDNIVGPFYFDYSGEEGMPAYKAAIEEGYFKYIELDGTIFTEEEIEVVEDAIGENYKSVFDDGNIKIYELF